MTELCFRTSQYTSIEGAVVEATVVQDGFHHARVHEGALPCVTLAHAHIAHVGARERTSTHGTALKARMLEVHAREVDAVEVRSAEGASTKIHT